MDSTPESLIPDPGDMTTEEQLVRAARDLWCMVHEWGETFVVFTDRRQMMTRVEQMRNGMFAVLWENEDGSWTAYERTFANLREAAFHGYQGPH